MSEATPFVVGVESDNMTKRPSDVTTVPKQPMVPPEAQAMAKRRRRRITALVFILPLFAVIEHAVLVLVRGESSVVKRV